MKKFIAIVLGAGAMIACTKTSVSYEPTGEIAFKPVAEINKTKTAVSTTAFPTDWTMGVYSYHMASESTVKADDGEFLTPTTYIDDKNFKKGDDNLWAGSPTAYYWPKTGSLVFAAYAPVTEGMPKVKHSFMVENGNIKEDKLYIENAYVQSNNTNNTVDFMWSPVTTTSYVKQESVPMKFKHAMSWITFKAKADAADVFTITGIELQKVSTEGKFFTAQNDITWNELSNPASIEVYTDETGTAVTTAVPDNGGIENVTNGTVVIPQSLGDDVIAVINFKEKSAGADTEIAHRISLKLNTCKSGGTELTKWEFGKHYTYVLSFGHTSADEIKISPSVEEWTPVEVTSGQIN